MKTTTLALLALILTACLGLAANPVNGQFWFYKKQPVGNDFAPFNATDNTLLSIQGGVITPQAMTSYQASDADLTQIAALTTTSFGRSVLTQADAAAMRSLMGLSSLATATSITSAQVSDATPSATPLKVVKRNDEGGAYFASVGSDAVKGISSAGGSGGLFESISGTGVSGVSSTGVGMFAYSDLGIGAQISSESSDIVQFLGAGGALVGQVTNSGQFLGSESLFSTADADGVHGLATNAGNGVLGSSDSGIGVFGTSTTGTGIRGSSDVIGVNGSSDLGVGGQFETMTGIGLVAKADSGIPSRSWLFAPTENVSQPIHQLSVGGSGDSVFEHQYLNGDTYLTWTQILDSSDQIDVGATASIYPPRIEVPGGSQFVYQLPDITDHGFFQYFAMVDDSQGRITPDSILGTEVGAVPDSIVQRDSSGSVESNQLLLPGSVSGYGKLSFGDGYYDFGFYNTAGTTLEKTWLVDWNGNFNLSMGGTLTANRQHNFPDGAGTYALTTNSNGTINASSLVTEPSNGSAGSGQLGQYAFSYIPVGSAVSLVNNTAKTITSVNLPAGDWDVSGNINYVASAATTTGTISGINTVNNTLPTDGSETYATLILTSVTTTNGSTIARKRISLSASATVYLVGRCSFTAGTVTAFGGLTVRRAR
jgi:hypothetical protein